ncbi:hypothetical protein ASG43_16975 [Aureimonas sp. Leaf454]|uniref:glycosyltransferase family protein n=1 Tax=Aureimonas sp. Leaf454 TaxID=1736381 RepID=UPI0006FDB31D|nr:hypothetical protein [Aureimonas sp. Leaf454]KQT42088.1 hypothetical protein ASG43_16975 [Aureimonas sp. Leaf454]
MTSRMTGKRLLIYSHDSYGLGHLRRCQTIANHLSSAHDDLSVLIISGSPVVGSFDLHPRVDFIRVPGIVKLDNNTYAPTALGVSTEELMEIRSVIILETARRYQPDVFLVDKEPLGLRGEVRDTLIHLKGTGTRNILGLREIMDEPERLRDEWERKGAIEAVDTLYDEIWVYGPKSVYDPLAGVGMSEKTTARIRYSGYLRRALGEFADEPAGNAEPYILATAGGGNDGAVMIDWLLSAYEADPTLLCPVKIVFGPFLAADERYGFRDRIARQPRIQAINFHTNMEAMVDGAAGLVTMGGYNTFCEILSFDKPALIVPRTHPRLEQLIRATRAQELGLARLMLPTGEPDDAARMAAALHALPTQPRPSAAGVADLLGGLERVERFFDEAVAVRRHRPALKSVG